MGSKVDDSVSAIRRRLLEQKHRPSRNTTIAPRRLTVELEHSRDGSRSKRCHFGSGAGSMSYFDHWTFCSMRLPRVTENSHSSWT